MYFYKSLKQYFYWSAKHISTFIPGIFLRVYKKFSTSLPKNISRCLPKLFPLHQSAKKYANTHTVARKVFFFLPRKEVFFSILSYFGRCWIWEWNFDRNDGHPRIAIYMYTVKIHYTVERLKIILHSRMTQQREETVPLRMILSSQNSPFPYAFTAKRPFVPRGSKQQSKSYNLQYRR